MPDENVTPATDVERATEPKFSMSAYYYSFEPTGVRVIDEVLSSVAVAGKAYHHTESWSDETEWAPKSHVTLIQEAAGRAAKVIAELRDALEEYGRHKRDCGIWAGRYNVIDPAKKCTCGLVTPEYTAWRERRRGYAREQLRVCPGADCPKHGVDHPDECQPDEMCSAEVQS